MGGYTQDQMRAAKELQEFLNRGSSRRSRGNNAGSVRGSTSTSNMSRNGPQVNAAGRPLHAPRPEYGHRVEALPNRPMPRNYSGSNSQHGHFTANVPAAPTRVNFDDPGIQEIIWEFDYDNAEPQATSVEATGAPTSIENTTLDHVPAETSSTRAANESINGLTSAIAALATEDTSATQVANNFNHATNGDSSTTASTVPTTASNTMAPAQIPTEVKNNRDETALPAQSPFRAALPRGQENQPTKTLLPPPGAIVYWSPSGDKPDEVHLPVPLAPLRPMAQAFAPTPRSVAGINNHLGPRPARARGAAATQRSISASGPTTAARADSPTAPHDCSSTALSDRGRTNGSTASARPTANPGCGGPTKILDKFGDSGLKIDYYQEDYVKQCFCNVFQKCPFHHGVE